MFIYERALELAEPSAAHQEAGLLFPGLSEEDDSASINLAFMLRRGEFVVDGLEVESVLSENVGEGDLFARVNLALHILRVSSSRDTWFRADALFARAVASDRITDVDMWWRKTASHGDSEGMFVLALLWRHGHLAANSDQLAEWWALAEGAGVEHSRGVQRSLRGSSPGRGWRVI